MHSSPSVACATVCSKVVVLLLLTFVYCYSHCGSLYCSMFCCTLLYGLSSIATILMGKRELVALLNLSPWCLVMVELLFLVVPWGCLRFVIVVFPDHTHLLFLMIILTFYFNKKTQTMETYFVILFRVCLCCFYSPVCFLKH